MRTWLIVLLLTVSFQQARAQGFLMWQAQQEDRTIHLLAVIPFVSPGVVTDLADEINQAYDASALVVFESDPDPERRREGQSKISAAALYPEGDSLINHLSDPVRKQYLATCSRRTIDTANLNRVRPWMAAQTLLKISMAQDKVRLGDDLVQSLYRRAVNDDRPMAFLNTPQVTISLYENMDAHQQERILEKALKDARNLTNFLPAVEAAWRSSDQEAATELMNESFAGFDDVHQTLFSVRNQGWAGDLDAQAGIEGEILALVSLSHLVGPENLLERLKDRGYRIAQVVPE